MSRETLYQVLLVILALVIVIMAFIWFTGEESIEDVRNDLEEEVIDYREQIRATCGDADSAEVQQNPDCRALLEEFAEILEDYQDRLGEASTSTATTAD